MRLVLLCIVRDKCAGEMHVIAPNANVGDVHAGKRFLYDLGCPARLLELIPVSFIEVGHLPEPSVINYVLGRYVLLRHLTVNVSVDLCVHTQEVISD